MAAAGRILFVLVTVTVWIACAHAQTALVSNNRRMVMYPAPVPQMKTTYMRLMRAPQPFRNSFARIAAPRVVIRNFIQKPFMQQPAFQPRTIQQQIIRQPIVQPIIHQPVMSPPIIQQRIMPPPIIHQRIMAPPIIQQRIMAPPIIQQRIMSPPIIQQRFMPPPIIQHRIIQQPIIQPIMYVPAKPPPAAPPQRSSPQPAPAMPSSVSERQPGSQIQIVPIKSESSKRGRSLPSDKGNDRTGAFQGTHNGENVPQQSRRFQDHNIQNNPDTLQGGQRPGHRQFQRFRGQFRQNGPQRRGRRGPLGRRFVSRIRRLRARRFGRGRRRFMGNRRLNSAPFARGQNRGRDLGDTPFARGQDGGKGLEEAPFLRDQGRGKGLEEAPFLRDQDGGKGLEEAPFFRDQDGGKGLEEAPFAIDLDEGRGLEGSPIARDQGGGGDIGSLSQRQLQRSDALENRGFNQRFEPDVGEDTTPDQDSTEDEHQKTESTKNENENVQDKNDTEETKYEKDEVWIENNDHPSIASGKEGTALADDETLPLGRRPQASGFEAGGLDNDDHPSVASGKEGTSLADDETLPLRLRPQASGFEGGDLERILGKHIAQTAREGAAPTNYKEDRHGSYIPVYVPVKEKKKHKISVIQSGFYIPGGSQMFGKFPKLGKCLKACAAAANCFGGDYDPWAKKCFFHTNVTACATIQAHKGLTHFKKVPCEVASAPTGLVLLGVQLFGGVEQRGLKSLAACIKKCATAGDGVPEAVADIAQQICFGVDYDFGSHRCYFHTSNANNMLCPTTGLTPTTPRDVVANPGSVTIILCPGP